MIYLGVTLGSRGFDFYRLEVYCKGLFFFFFYIHSVKDSLYRDLRIFIALLV